MMHFSQQCRYTSQMAGDTELPVGEQGDSLLKCYLELNRVWEEI